MKTIKIAITGLKESGKTIFITSLINHFLVADIKRLEALKDRSIELYGVPQICAGKFISFPYEVYINDFKRNPPKWPEKTVDIYEYTIKLSIKHENMVKKVKLKIVDYPGERLLDAPMLKYNFDEWSEMVINEAKTGKKEFLSGEWLESINNIKTVQDAKIAAKIYQDYVYKCVENNLTHVQPALTVFKAEKKLNKIKKRIDTQNIDLDFCPIPKKIRDNNYEVYDLFNSKYKKYKKKYLKPFFKKVIKTNAIQFVLVDVLDALQGGTDKYNDLKKCIEDAIDCYRYSPLFSFCSGLFPYVKQVNFVATKADKCAKKLRENLRYLLRELVKKAYNNINMNKHNVNNQIDYLYCASHQCTEDVSDYILKGKILNESGKSVIVEKEAQLLPKQWPDSWEQNEFHFNDFLPVKLPKRDGATIGHIELDKIIYKIIKEVL